MGVAQVAAAAVIASTTNRRPVTPTPSQRRGNNPPAPKPPPPPKVAAPQNRAERRADDNVQKLKNEIAELKKSTNQQLLTEVKFLRGRNTELEARVAKLEGDLATARAAKPADPVLTQIKSDAEGQRPGKFAPAGGLTQGE